MIEKERLKQFGELVYFITNNKSRTIELINWAILDEKRIQKMMNFLNNNQTATYSQIQYQMSLIVAEEEMQ